MGIEGYAPYDWDELNELVSLLRVRKAIQKTKVLNVTDRPGKPPVCLLAGINEKELKEKFGVDYQYVSYKEFFDEMDIITQSNPEQEKAKDIKIYLTKSIMEKYNCNAFIIECFELCGSRIAADRKITPCLTNILLKEEVFAKQVVLLG